MIKSYYVFNILIIFFIVLNNDLKIFKESEEENKLNRRKIDINKRIFIKRKINDSNDYINDKNLDSSKHKDILLKFNKQDIKDKLLYKKSYLENTIEISGIINSLNLIIMKQFLLMILLNIFLCIF